MVEHVRRCSHQIMTAVAREGLKLRGPWRLKEAQAVRCLLVAGVHVHGSGAGRGFIKDTWEGKCQRTKTMCHGVTVHQAPLRPTVCDGSQMVCRRDEGVRTETGGC